MDFHGALTGRSLNDITSLSMPWRMVNGQLRPVFSQEAAQLSLELAATAYDLKMERWREAGWRDVSYQTETSLLTGPAANGGQGRGLGEMVSDYLQRLARNRLKRRSPIRQLSGALRQKENTDRCKAVVMIHPIDTARYMVAIGFMGTGKQIYDWFPNFRVANEQGMHQGFLRLAEDFEDACEEILFPDTARELGLPQLTLSDILSECRRPGSRFRIWMAGHSQGGAVMQLFALQQIQQGLLRQNLIGYGFASPSVIYDALPCDMSNFPLYHIMNGDDLVPRVGAMLHIGRCRLMHTDEEMRRVCYGEAQQEAAFQDVRRMAQTIMDTRHALAWVMGLLRAMERLSDAEVITMVSSMAGRFLPDRLTESIGGHVDELLRSGQAKVTAAYQQATGEEQLPEPLIAQHQRQISALLAAYGAKGFVKAFRPATSLPHKLRGNSMEEPASYQYIVNQRFDELRQSIVGPFAPPAYQTQPWASRPRHLPGGRFARLSTARNQRAERKAPRTNDVGGIL